MDNKYITMSQKEIKEMEKRIKHRNNPRGVSSNKKQGRKTI